MPETTTEKGNSLQFNFRPSSPDLSAEEYFLEYNSQLAAAKARRNPAPEDDETALTITEPYTSIDPLSITAASPKKIVRAAIDAGFTVTAARARTFKRGAIIKSGAKAGQRWADKDHTHLYVMGKHSGLAWFRLHYEGAKTQPFDVGWVWDVAGTPLILSDGDVWVDHSPRLVKTAFDLDTWMHEMSPSYPAPGERKKKEPASFEELVNAGEWNG